VFTSGTAVESCVDPAPEVTYLDDQCDGPEVIEDAEFSLMPMREEDSVCALWAYTADWVPWELDVVWPPTGPMPGHAEMHDGIDFITWTDAGGDCVDATAPEMEVRAVGDLEFISLDHDAVAVGAPALVGLNARSVLEPCVGVRYGFEAAVDCGVSGPSVVDCESAMDDQLDLLTAGLPAVCAGGNAHATDFPEWVSMALGAESTTTFGSPAIPLCAEPYPYVAAADEDLAVLTELGEGAHLHFGTSIGDEVSGSSPTCPVDAFLPDSGPRSIPTSVVEAMMLVPVDREPAETATPLICIEPS
jgi:hypothetical protein